MPPRLAPRFLLAFLTISFYTRSRLAEQLRFQQELVAFSAAFVTQQQQKQPPTTKEELWAKLQAGISFMCESAGVEFDKLPKNGYGKVLLALVPEYETLPVGPSNKPYKTSITQFW